MSPKKFFKHVVKVKNRMTFAMSILAYIITFLILGFANMFEWSSTVCMTVFLVTLMAHYMFWKFVIIKPVDKRLFSQLDDRIIMENKELVKLLVDHKITLPCHLGPIIKELDKLQPKDI